MNRQILIFFRVKDAILTVFYKCMDMLYLKRRYNRVELGEVCHSQNVLVVRIRSHVCEFCPRCLVADSNTKDHNTVVSCPLCRQLCLFRSGGLPICQDDGNIRNFRSVAIDSLHGQKFMMKKNKHSWWY